MNNIKVDPLNAPEIQVLMDMIKKAINKGNSILNFIDDFSNIPTETPLHSVNNDLPMSPMSPSYFFASPIKTRKYSGIYSLDGSSTKYNNSHALIFVKYLLLNELKELFHYIKGVYKIVNFEMNDLIDKFLQCIIIVVSMSIVIEDSLASTEGIDGKVKFSVKGKKYVMDVLFRLRLHLINILNELKYNASEEILFTYKKNLLNSDAKFQMEKKAEKINVIDNIISREIKDYFNIKNGSNNDQILKGNLYKRKKNEKFITKGWVKKYFILTHRALKYSDNDNSKDGRILMFCDYNCIELIPEEDDKDRKKNRLVRIRLFSHQDPKQTILIKSNDEIEALLWFNQIRDKMYINSPFFLNEVNEDEKDDVNEKYRNLTNEELRDLVKYISVEEKIKTNIIKYTFLKKMDEIAKSAPNQEPVNNYTPTDSKDLLVKLERLRNENMDLFLSITTDNKQEDIIINIMHKKKIMNKQ